jgi:hypothetical protein
MFVDLDAKERYKFTKSWQTILAHGNGKDRFPV